MQNALLLKEFESEYSQAIDIVFCSKLVRYISYANVDEFGRFILPKAIRKDLYLNYRDKMFVWSYEEIIYVKKINTGLELPFGIGWIRIVDELGRIVIPKNLRRDFDITPKSVLNIGVGRDNIIRITESHKEVQE